MSILSASRPSTKLTRNDIHPAVSNLLFVAARFGGLDPMAVYVLGSEHGDDWMGLADAIVGAAAGSPACGDVALAKVLHAANAVRAAIL